MLFFFHALLKINSSRSKWGNKKTWSRKTNIILYIYFLHISILQNSNWGNDRIDLKQHHYFSSSSFFSLSPSFHRYGKCIFPSYYAPSLPWATKGVQRHQTLKAEPLWSSWLIGYLNSYDINKFHRDEKTTLKVKRYHCHDLSCLCCLVSKPSIFYFRMH